MKYDFSNKNILILGFGVEGMDTLQFLRKKFPKKIIGIADQKTKDKLSKEAQDRINTDRNLHIHTGDTYQSCFSEYDVIIKSPGVPLSSSYIAKLNKQKKIVTSQTDIFMQRFAKNTIGITGTKGKSTTTTLIYEILKSAKDSIFLVGNIGQPPLALYEESSESLFVFEFSSHQLQHTSHSPHVAVILNVYREHLDYYKDFSSYIKAKSNIARFQTTTDYIVANAEDEHAKAIAATSSGKKIEYALHSQSGNCFIQNGYIVYTHASKTEKIIALSDIPLVGTFNYGNVMAAIVVAKIYGIATKDINKKIQEFTPLTTRLENIGTYKGITFYDDSLATIPEASIAAIDALGNAVETIIVGGFDRGQQFGSFAKRIIQSPIKNVILFLPSGKRIWQEIQKIQRKQLPKKYIATSMKEAVKIAYHTTKKGKICLLSSASPSFGMFKNYKDKSHQFRKYVKKYNVS